MTQQDLHVARFPRVFDSTMISTARSCYQKFFREYIERRATSAISPDLHAGGALARALEVARVAYYRDGKSQDEAITEALYSFLPYWGDYEPPPSNPKTRDATWGAFMYYLQQWPFATDYMQPQLQNGSPSVEFTFAEPLPINHPETGDPLLYAGRFDMLGEMHGTLWVDDEKSTKYFYKEWSKKWRMRGQFQGYTWACRKNGIPVEGAVVRGIAIQKTQYQHLEAIVQIFDWEIERWYEQMLRTIEDLINCWRQGYWDYDLAHSCESFGGCSYFDLCTSANPENWYGDFVERVWNPLAQDPTAPTANEETRQNALL